MFASRSSRPTASGVPHVRFLEPNGGPNRRRGRLDDDNSSSSGSDRDDDEDSLDEEERLDRELSRRHGEAVEARTNSNKRSAAAEGDGGADADIDALYQNGKRAKAKRAPDLTVESLTGTEGLIRIQTDFFRADHMPPMPSTSSVTASSRFALAVVEAYKSFCFHLMPNVAFEDALLKIERFGSKRPVKKYLDEMRQHARNKHVETALGSDRATRVLQELHDAMQLFDDDHGGEGGGEQPPSVDDPSSAADPTDSHGEPRTAAEAEGAESMESTAAPPVRTSSAVPAGGYDDSREDEEQEATFDNDNDQDETLYDTVSALGTDRAVHETQYDTVSALGTDGAVATASSPHPSPSRTVPPPPSRRPPSARHVFDDTDSESDEDANDPAARTTTTTIKSRENTSSGPAPSSAAASAVAQRRRFVFDDDESDDDDVDEGSVADTAPAAVSSPPTSPVKEDREDRGSTRSPPQDPSASEPMDAIPPRNSTSPTHPSVVAMMPPLAQDSPLGTLTSTSSSPPAASSTESPAPLASSRSRDSNESVDDAMTSPSEPSLDDGNEKRLDVESNIGDGDDEDETATVVPSTMTGPTQWADDDDEMEED